MVAFADTSHYQTVDLAAYKAGGYDRIVIKATGGATDGSLRFVDPTFAIRWRQAGDLGLHRVAYHFARNGNSGADEFAWCWSQIQAAGGMNPDDVLCYDQEDNRGAAAGVQGNELADHVSALVVPQHAERLYAAVTAGAGITSRQHGPALAELARRGVVDIGPNWRAARQRTKEFVAAAVQAGVRNGWVYSGKWYLEPAGIVASDLPAGWRVLWLSDYTAGQADTAIEVPAGWGRSQLVARQYTDATSYPGIPAPCDGNRSLYEWLTDQEGDMPLTQDDANLIMRTFNVGAQTDHGAQLDGLAARIADMVKARGGATAAQVQAVATALASNAAAVNAGISDTKSAVLAVLAALPTSALTDEQRAELAADVAAKVDGLQQDEVEAALRHVFADAATPDQPPAA